MNTLTQSTTKKQRRKPICKSCLTPMKGHLKTGGKKGRCRPNLWCNHGDNNKEHGGHYEWEKQRWNGTEWKPIEGVAAAKNEVVVQTPEETELEKFIGTGTVIHMKHYLADDPPAPKEPEEPKESPPPPPKEPDEPKEAEESKDEWKPLADGYWWNYYKNWQANSTWVKFPTLVGMTGAQLGDIMENYGKYRKFYD